MLDYAYSPEGSLLFNFGIEGTSYTIVNGVPTYVDAVMHDPKIPSAQMISRFARGNFNGPFVQDVRYITQYYELPEQKEALKVWTQPTNEKLLPPLTVTQDESKKFASTMTDINTRYDEVFNRVWSGKPGLQNFQDFFASVYFVRLMVNTVAISVLDLVFGFPAPIILALLLNELRWNPFKGLVQTVTYLPHFISVVVVVGMLFDFFARDGLVNDLIASASPTAFMQSPEWFRQLFVGSGIWQQVGWGSIVYLAAIANIDPQLYDAAKVDGASRFKLIRHVTLPGILPVIVILLILRLGSIMSVGYEKIILMYNPLTYETADVISTYVFRRGILQADFSFSAAVGLFNSVINFALLIGANRISRRLTGLGLW